MTEVVRNRAIGAAVLVAPAAIFGVLTLWSIVSFAAAR
jgi:cell division septation protein DedD